MLTPSNTPSSATSDKPLKTTLPDSTEILKISTLISEWRKNRKSQRSPMPSQIKSLIYQLYLTDQYSSSAICKKLSISFSQIKAIRNQFNKNTDIGKEANPEMLPFKLIPHNTKETTDSSTNATPSKSNILTPNPPIKEAAISKEHCKYITINKANGANISLPDHLGKDLLFNIVEAFLCSK